MAICRVARCDTLYTDDKSLIECAKLCDIATVRLCDLPLPETARQHKLDLDRTRNCRRQKMTKRTMAAKPTPEGQSERFIQAARELECDEDEARWDERLRKVAKPRPEAEESE